VSGDPGEQSLHGASPRLTIKGQRLSECRILFPRPPVKRRHLGSIFGSGRRAADRRSAVYRWPYPLVAPGRQICGAGSSVAHEILRWPHRLDLRCCRCVTHRVRLRSRGMRLRSTGCSVSFCGHCVAAPGRLGLACACAHEASNSASELNCLPISGQSHGATTIRPGSATRTG
jgi:hypothetical protein